MTLIALSATATKVLPIGVPGAGTRLLVHSNGVWQLPNGASCAWEVLVGNEWRRPGSELRLRRRRELPTICDVFRVNDGDIEVEIGVFAAPQPCAVVEVRNDTSAPIAIRFGAREYAVLHRTSAVFVISLDGQFDVERKPTESTTSMPSCAAVTAGWSALLGHAVQLDGFDPQFEATFVRALMLLLLSEPTTEADFGDVQFAASRLAGFDELADRYVTEPQSSTFIASDKDSFAGFRASRSQRIEVKALGLLSDIDMREVSATRVTKPSTPRQGGEYVISTLHSIVQETNDALILFPAGVAKVIEVGMNCSVSRIHTVHGVLDVALRWHGGRPAVLWQLEQLGDKNLVIRCGADANWATNAAQGEQLF